MVWVKMTYFHRFFQTIHGVLTTNLTIGTSFAFNPGAYNENGGDIYNDENGDDNNNKPDNLRFSCLQPRCSDRQEDIATSPGDHLNISL